MMKALILLLALLTPQYIPTGVHAPLVSNNTATIHLAGSTSEVIPWLTGTSAGDLVIIAFGSTGTLASTPSGWTLSNVSTGSFLGEAGVLNKTLTSGDITTGSVTVSQSAASAFVYSIIDVAGGGTIREIDSVRSGLFPATQAVSTSSAVLTTDHSYYFTTGGTNSLHGADASQWTSNQGSLLHYAIGANNDVGATLYGAFPSSAGVTTVTFTYASATDPDFAYVAAIVEH